MEKISGETEQSEVETYNPNSIGEVVSLGRGLETSPDKVYRSVKDRRAIDDIRESGVVRNRESAGLGRSRWGDRVFWSRGAEGKFHMISPSTFVIEAPLAVAEKRVVERGDITGVYTMNEKGEIVDIFAQETEQEEEKKRRETNVRKEADEERLRQLERELGL